MTTRDPGAPDALMTLEQARMHTERVAEQEARVGRTVDAAAVRSVLSRLTALTADNLSLAMEGARNAVMLQEAEAALAEAKGREERLESRHQALIAGTSRALGIQQATEARLAEAEGLGADILRDVLDANGFCGICELTNAHSSHCWVKSLAKYLSGATREPPSGCLACEKIVDAAIDEPLGGPVTTALKRALEKPHTCGRTPAPSAPPQGEAL